jgi:Na+-translocating ferredoxin:NAD+ oxidoreductase subunit A
VNEFLAIFIGAALVNNLVFIQFLGVSAFFAAANRIRYAATMGILTAIVLVTSALVNHAVFHLLLKPFELEFLQLLFFVAICALITTGLMICIRRYFPRSFRRQQLPIFMIGANSAVIGSSILMIAASYTFMQSLAFSVGGALGFAAVLLLFAALRERLDTADLPLAFRGLAIELLCAGLAAMSLLGFEGIV